MEESPSKFTIESAKRHEEKSNLIKEIQASMDASIRNQGASIKTLEIQIGQMSNALQEKGFGSLPGASVSVMPFSTYNNLGLDELAHTKLTIELANKTVKHPKGIAENVLVGIGKFVLTINFIILDMPEDVKVPLILERPFLSTAYAKIDVFKRKITVRAGGEKIIFKSVKPASSLTKRVYILRLRERMELDLEARLMGETLLLNRSLDPLYRDYIKLNDLNKPLELRRNQVDELKPTIEEVVENIDAYRYEGMGEVIVGEPFCKASNVETRRFDGMITIFNGNDNVTYQATYQRRVDKVFSDQIRRNLEAYVDDMVIKSISEEDMLQDIQETFMKLNPKKCSFGVEEGLFLGHLITKQDTQKLYKQKNHTMDTGGQRSPPKMKKFMEILPTLTAPIKGEALTMYLTDLTKSFAKRDEG
ncbi:DNA-directed DNA polymerase [Tanacetum coccineum]